MPYFLFIVPFLSLCLCLVRGAAVIRYGLSGNPPPAGYPPSVLPYLPFDGQEAFIANFLQRAKITVEIHRALTERRFQKIIPQPQVTDSSSAKKS